LHIVKLLEWDSKFFGFPVAQIQSNTIEEAHLDQVFSFCREHQVRLLQFKCDAHHRPSILLAEKGNFHFADVRITLHKRLTVLEGQPVPLPKKLSLREGEISDIPALKEIVTDLYSHSRYYFDTNFPRNDVHGFYQNWIEKSVRGLFDDLVWVLCQDDFPIGCCSVSHAGDQMASIGLFGINPGAAGKGFGSLLMQNVLYAMFHKNIRTVSVITQGRNYGAQRLYQRAGFYNEKMEIYYHKWFSGNQGDWS
jgi:dTDP-4-amino-4,6-dideoxy-D-galactose acyltransferase